LEVTSLNHLAYNKAVDGIMSSCKIRCLDMLHCKSK